MGVELQLWVIPRERVFRPQLDHFAGLANALRKENWVPSLDAHQQRSRVIELLPGSEGPIGKKPIREHTHGERIFSASWLECLTEHEVCLEWKIDNVVEAGAKYPLTFDPYPDSGPPYFSIRLLWAHDYVYETSECVTPFAERETTCSCGEQLAYHTGFSGVIGSGRIHRTCPKGGRDFDASSATCEILDGWTGEPSPLRGGLAFRFALQVDCGKYFPREEEKARRFGLRPEFLELWTAQIGVPFEQITTAG